MIDWKRVPWSLWLFCATALAGSVVTAVDTHRTIPAEVLFAALVLAWIYYLLKAVEWLWILTIGVSVLSLVPFALTAPSDWLGAVGSLFGLALLLLPMTRRYFADGTPAAEAGK